MFYVDRRANVIKLNEYQPFSLNKLPTPIAGFERINNRVVEYHQAFLIRSDVYSLRSVVCAKVNEATGDSNFVIGSTALVRKLASAHGPEERVCYDPYEAPKHSNKAYVSVTDAQFKEMAQELGTVFIYELTEDNTKGELSV